MLRLSISGQIFCAPKFENSHKRSSGIRFATPAHGQRDSTMALTMTSSARTAIGALGAGLREQSGRVGTRANIAARRRKLIIVSPGPCGPRMLDEADPGSHTVGSVLVPFGPET